MDNRRETGGRVLEPREQAQGGGAFSQAAAKNSKPDEGGGLSRDVGEKRDGSVGDGVERHATPSPDTVKVSGAGPAIAEHSKDAKAPKSGRQPGAYVKD